VTHMHGDHVFGLPGLLRAVSRRVQELGISKAGAFQIYGPPGT
jgi:ribonuclease BN (tRNA processing enzyme)